MTDPVSFRRKYVIEIHEVESDGSYRPLDRVYLIPARRPGDGWDVVMCEDAESGVPLQRTRKGRIRAAAKRVGSGSWPPLELAVRALNGIQSTSVYEKHRGSAHES